jgi:FMN phosphatase YigB (HAD superfamily)
MAVETYYRIEDLIAAADRLLDGIDCVSIDIFDTLFIRRIHDPDEVKRPVSKFIADVADQHGIRVSADRVWEMRNDIEAEQRARNGKDFPDHEARYDDFMTELLQAVFDDQLPEDFLDDVAAFELRVESAMIVVRRAFAAWLEELKKRGKRVILVSDIYLPADHLKQLVADKGLGDYVEDTVSSADSFNAKASGSAWPLIKERFGLSPERWLHIGDNPISDGARPDEFGIKAMVLRDLGEKHRLGIARQMYAASRNNPLLRGRYIQQLMLPLEEENQEVPALYTDGYNFLGPLLGFFCLSVLDYCRKNAIDRLYFCAREGWSLMRVFEEILPYLAPEGNFPETSYLYVSRIAVAQASCARSGLTELGVSAALLPGNNRDFRDVCRVFSLDLEPLLPFLERYDLSAHDPIGSGTPGVTPALRRKLRELLMDEEFQDEIRHQARPAQLKLESYLNQEGFFDHRDVALVDIGWLGTIQHFLVESIHHRLNKPRVHGLLLGASRQMPYRDNHESRVQGILYDRLRFSFPESLVETVKDVFEETCRAPHPSVIGYRRKYAEVEPVLRDAEDEDALAEAEQNVYYAPLRQGVFDAAARFGAAMAVAGYGPHHLKPWLNFLLTSRIAFPTSAEVERIRHRSHQDDFSGKHKIPRKIERANRTLWQCSTTRLKFDPFVRIYYYLLHALRLLRS